MKISFCTTCKNRLWQFKQTVFDNLNEIARDGNSELILVDYNDTQGLENFVKDNLQYYIDNDILIYLQEKDSEFFDMSRAKNLSHLGSNGDYLFNLDADNFIRDLIPRLREILKIDTDIVSHAYDNIDRGGFGRIGISRNIFNKLGGYDEDMSGVWGEDTDLIFRCLSNSLKFAHIIQHNKVLTVPNTREDTTKHTKDINLTCIDQYERNKLISNIKMDKGIIIRNNNRKRVKLLKNFSEIVYV